MKLKASDRVASFKYLGLHFHFTRAIAGVITPLKAKTTASWAVVQHKHACLQCGDTVNRK